MTKEIWKTVPEYPEYAASNLGRIKRIATDYVLKPRKSKTGYLQLHLMRKTVLVHRIILRTFKGLPPPSHETAHGDGIRTNNKISNLRWALKKDNANDRRKHGTILDQQGSKNHNAKFTERRIRRIRSLRKKGVKVLVLADKFNTHPVNISRICNGHTWRHV